MKVCGFGIGKGILFTLVFVAICHVVLLYHYNSLSSGWLPSYFSSERHDRRSSEEYRSILNAPLSSFHRHWVDWNRWRFNYERFHRACADFRWTKQEGVPWFELTNHTDPTRGVVREMEIRRAGEFSRFVLHSQNSRGEFKRSGGDHWRVQIRGPSSSSVVTVQTKDRSDGSYEFKFLLHMSGTYEVLIWLEYTLCAGLKEPPPDWFIKGTVQGKEQKQGTLHRDFPFINKPLWNGASFKFNVAEPITNKSEFDLHSLCATSSKQVTPHNCNLLWNGHGYWANKITWVPLCPSSSEWHYPTREFGKTRRSVLWIFGDSVSAQFYHQVKFHPLCKKHFARCMYTYNWLYSLENYNATLKRYTRKNSTVEKGLWDTLDFDVGRIVDELRQVLLHPAMQNHDSVLLLNYGLHFAESLNFTNFKTTIDAAARLLQNEAKCHVVWRTTTSLNRYKYSQPHMHARRFMTQPRIELYNAYSSTAFCDAGFDILDVYPITDAYPEGTGTKKTPHDPVHYEYHVMQPMERLLERVFHVTE